MISIAKVWENKDKNGEVYFSGYLGDARIIILKNKFKTAEKHPDYVVCVDAKNKDKNTPQNTTNQNNYNKNNNQNNDDYDIPF